MSSFSIEGETIFFCFDDLYGVCVEVVGFYVIRCVID